MTQTLPAPETTIVEMAVPAIDEVDQITLQVANNFLVTTAREMGIAMRNTAYSPLFNEGLDFSCAIFDAGGEMIAQAEFCPAQLGAMIFVVEWTIHEIGSENFNPEDVVFHNDPFRGGCHLPEYCVIKPVFYNDETRGVRFLHRAHDRGGRQGARWLRRRRHRGVPGRAAHPATEDRGSGRRRRGHLEHHHGQCPHAADVLRRLEIDDRLAVRGGAAGHGVGGAPRPGALQSSGRGHQGLFRAPYARRDFRDARWHLRLLRCRHRQRRRDRGRCRC